MRPDLIEEEYLESEKRRLYAKPWNTAPRVSDKFVDRPAIRPEPDKLFKRSVDFQEDNTDFTLVSADEEWVCEKCGAEIPPAGRFCAACGHATGYSARPHVLSDIGTRIRGWYAAVNDVAARNGLTPASQIALAVAAFCIGGAIIVQLSVPSASPWFSQAELYQAYAIRTLLWLAGGIVALIAAIVFKQQSRIL
jgi:hypothetical protein